MLSQIEEFVNWVRAVILQPAPGATIATTCTRSSRLSGIARPARSPSGTSTASSVCWSNAASNLARSTAAWRLSSRYMLFSPSKNPTWFALRLAACQRTC